MNKLIIVERSLDYVYISKLDLLDAISTSPIWPKSFNHELRINTAFVDSFTRSLIGLCVEPYYNWKVSRMAKFIDNGRTAWEVLIELTYNLKCSLPELNTIVEKYRLLLGTLNRSELVHLFMDQLNLQQWKVPTLNELLLEQNAKVETRVKDNWVEQNPA